MTKQTLKFSCLLIALTIVLAACSPAATPAPSAGANADVQYANSTDKSPCIGIQPVAGENIQPNGGGKWPAPDQVIDVTHVYCAIFTTNNGRIVAELFPKIASKNVNNFVFLAKNGFY